MTERNHYGIGLCFLFLFCSNFLQATSLDVVIPVHKKDAKNLDFIIDTLTDKIVDIGNIYIVSDKKYTDRATWIDEKDFPFTIAECAREIGRKGGIGNCNRRGWYYQQVLKFYCHEVIENLTDNYLIWDADSIPMHKVRYFDEEGRVFLHTVNQRTHSTYYAHMAKVLPDLGEVDRSFHPIVNHMVFTKEILHDLFTKVEGHFEKPFWKVFLNAVNMDYAIGTFGFLYGASEYLIYYNFCMKYHPDMVVSKQVLCRDRAANIKDMRLLEKYDFITGHILIKL